MIEKFKVRFLFGHSCEPKITRVKCDQETEKWVLINGQRNLKEGEYAIYFNTYETARIALFRMQSKIVRSNARRLKWSQEILKEIMEL